MRAGSSPDNAGTVRHCQTRRVRQARPEGVRRGTCVKPRKSCHRAPIWRIWARGAVRDRSLPQGWSTPKPVSNCRWGGHAEGLRRRRGDAAGVVAGRRPGRSAHGERGNRLWAPPISRHPVRRSRAGPLPAEVRRWGGGPVVVRAEESSAHGEGGQQVGREDAAMPGGRW